MEVRSDHVGRWRKVIPPLSRSCLIETIHRSKVFWLKVVGYNRLHDAAFTLALTLAEREEISRSVAADCRVRSVARRSGVHPPRSAAR